MFAELTTVKGEEKFIINLSCLVFVSECKSGCCLHTVDGDSFYVLETYEHITGLCHSANEVEKSRQNV